jgi:excisionase family DNA binding protein
MPAYDIRQREQTARLLHLEPGRHQADARVRGESIETTAVAPRAVTRAAIDEASIIDLVVDRLADRLAAAIVARLGRERDQQDEWLDSRQAAEYLGLHRDTLRRLAAARAIPREQDGRGCKLFFRRTVLDEWRRVGGRASHLSAMADAG